ncbi:MAG: T9SS type A sorting domain-containing protein [Saprospiraceae bacterium]
MKKQLTLTLVFLGLQLHGFSQNFILNQYFGSIETQPCPFDSNISIKQPADWFAYQTQDGHWDGPFDSTRCLSFVAGTGNFYATLDLGMVDPDKPLFIRSLLPPIPERFELLENQLFNAIFEAKIKPSCIAPVLRFGSDCEDGICSGVFLSLLIPDEDLNEYGAFREHTGLFNGNLSSNCYTTSQFCFPSEYFFNQKLGYAVMKFSFAPNAQLANHQLELRYAQIEQTSMYELGTISEVTALGMHWNAVTQEYDVPVYDASDFQGWGTNFLGLYTAPAYPSAQNLSYIEAVPEPNSSTPQIINLNIDEFQTLVFQPFAQLRGGLVSGSNSIRHIANLNNNGGEICLNLLDLIFENGNEYRHTGGDLYMNNPYSCMQFRKQSALHILNEQSLHYGQDGVGMLAMCAEGTIHIEPGSELIVDAILNLAECDDALPPQHIDMDLPRGASLRFTEHAKVTNQYSQGQQMKLRVHMLGGTLDDALLSAEDRALIQRVYPEPDADISQNVVVYPNPATGPFSLDYLSVGQESVQLYLLNLNGQVVYTQVFDAEKGWNHWEIKTELAAGTYVLRCHTPQGIFTEKMICLNR